MNWADFNDRHENVTDAFEAFGCQLFSRWCKYEYGKKLVCVYDVGGRGGDGGVEAFAKLSNGDVVGFQAKWFRDGFNAIQSGQVAASLHAAKKRYTRLSRYIVCMPLELEGSKGRANEGKSQLERWQELEENEATPIEFWGDRGIEGKAIEANFTNLLDYWFNRSFMNFSKWGDMHRRTVSAHFDERYIPDLHIAGQYDSEMKACLWGNSVRNEFSQQLFRRTSLFNSMQRHLARIPRLPEWEKLGNDGRLDLKALAVSADATRKEILEFATSLIASEDISVKEALELEDKCADLQTQVAVAIKHLEPFTADFRLTPLSPCQECLEKTGDQIYSLQQMLPKLTALSQPLALIGEPGSGKTHSVVDTASKLIEAQIPALIIPAGQIDLSLEVGRWLANFLDRPLWSLEDALSAMEAACYETDRQLREVGASPHRFLLAIDGLEESPRCNRWKSALIKLLDAVKSHPRIALVCTVRSNPAKDCLPARHNGFARRVFPASTQVSLSKLFWKYCFHFRIDASKTTWVQWALQSPLDIRLFAQVYRGQHLDGQQDINTSTAPLLKASIEKIETELAGHTDNGWSCHDHVLLASLMTLADDIAKSDKPYLTHAQVIEVVRRADDALQEFTRLQLDHLIDGCVTHGLLLRHRIQAEDPLASDITCYELAFHTLIDYLLARNLSNSLGDCQQNIPVPSIMSKRHNALALFLQIVNDDTVTYAVPGGEISLVGVSTESGESAQLVALSRSLKRPPEAVVEWVKKLFLKDMPSNRQVLALLIVPTARNNEHWCGGKFAHEILRGMTVGDRDLLWSGPDYLPQVQGAIWAGRAEYDMDSVSLNDCEPYNGAPLLLAWNCSSVIEKRVRKCRSRLALWGSRNPSDMAKLLGLMAEVDDPQVLENVFVAAAGAVTLCEDHEGVLEMAGVCHRLFFTREPGMNIHNGITRHAARVVVEKAALLDGNCGDMLESARPPYRVDIGEPFCNLPDGAEPSIDNLLAGDLEWYVVKRATKGFFEDVGRNAGESPEVSLASRVPDRVFEAVKSGEVKLENDQAEMKFNELLTKEAVDNEKGDPWSELLKPFQTAIANSQKASQLSNSSGGLNIGKPSFEISQERDSSYREPNGFADIKMWNAAIDAAGDGASEEDIKKQCAIRDPGLFERMKQRDEELEKAAKEREEQEKQSAKLIQEVWGNTPRTVAYSEQAEELLERYRDITERSSLHPDSLRDVLIYSFARNLGWNSDLFYGQPKGGKSGEVLGADIAIKRRHHPATHGSRSAIASFGEKYVWCAVNELAGYLADRLPRTNIFTHDTGIVTDYSDLGAGMPDPFEVGTEKSEENIAYDPLPLHANFWPSFKAQGHALLKASSDWCRNAPWPEVESFISTVDDAIIYSKIVGYEPNAYACQIVNVSSFVVDTDDWLLFKRDLDLGAVDFFHSDVDGWKGIIAGEQCYRPPTLACWAPWMESSEDEFEHFTLLTNGNVHRAVLKYLTTSTYWTPSGNEEEVLIPSPILRKSLRIASSHGNAKDRFYFDSQGNPVGSYREATLSDRGYHQLLVCDKEKFETFQASENKRVGWMIEVYREVPPQLYLEKSEIPQIRRRKVYFVINEGDDLSCVWEKETQREGI